MAKFELSLGAPSQWLNAVESVYVAGARKDPYAADLELSRFAAGFIMAELQSWITQSKERIAPMREPLKDMEGEDKESMKVRLQSLQHFLDRADKVLPWILRFLVR